MTEPLNFILGAGERLTEPIPAPGRLMPSRDMPYSQDEAIARLLPEIDNLSSTARQLPDESLVGGELIATVTLHPQFLAKSWYPTAALDALGVRNVGSRGVMVRPESWTRKGAPEISPSTQLFVAGAKATFEGWSAVVGSATEDSPFLAQLPRIEAVGIDDALDRIRLSSEDDGAEILALEAVLHSGDDPSVSRAFQLWGEQHAAEVDLRRRLQVPGLAFIPLRAARGELAALASFSFLRVVRSLPRLRGIRPTEITRSSGSLRLRLPTEGALDPDLRAAVFDGGLEPEGPLAPWTSSFDSTSVGDPDEEWLIHGHRVTSALLFGSLPRSGDAPRPFARVDHYRVLDLNTERDPEDLFDVLPRILGILSSKSYEFVNLSIGPHLPMEDTEPHAWTSVLDEYLSDGKALVSVAVGNDGDKDRASGNARIQPPADCVNALAVGAADSTGESWSRAPYSCMGPGRSPGLVKPDVVAFGGTASEPFEVLDYDGTHRTVPTLGTSFAGPATLRMGLGLRALLGSRLSPLAAKALLIHCADPGAHDQSEVGWGRVPQELERLAVCPAGSVRVLYQGTLDPAGYVRMQVPLPNYELAGYVTVAATICYATQVDPSHSDAYTKAGLDIVFRPHSGRLANEDGSTVAKSRPFFQLRQFAPERELRADAHKWETALNRSDRMRGSSLQAPVFDIHYNARDAGHGGRDFSRIRYAGVITVSAPRHPQLYNEVLRAYSGQLEAFAPVIDIPLRA